jgi:archaeoflavoprotein AfpA
MVAAEMLKKRKVAWGITGAGDRLAETIEVMEQVREERKGVVEVQVYVSKAGEQVLRTYRFMERLEKAFGRVVVEVDANSPFLAGWLQTGRFEFLLVAPASSNTVAKVAVGISDSLLSNAVIMGLKGSVPVYVLPTDFGEGVVVTKLPDGRDLSLVMRKEDVDNVRRLREMKGVFVLEKPEEIRLVFDKHFGR